MRKILIAIAGIIVVVLVIGFLALYNLGTLIERAVNHYGPQITKTDVSIGDVDVAMMAGKAELRSFLLGNPEGFAGDTAMAVKSVRVDINEKTIMEDPLVIEEIRVVDPVVNYQVKGRTDNFRTILANVRQAAGIQKAPPEKQPETAPTEPKRKIIIEDFYFSGGEVELSMAGLERNVRAAIPDIHMENIGGRGGTVPAEAVGIIMEKIYEVIRSGQVKSALNKRLQELGVDPGRYGLDLFKPKESLRKGVEQLRKGAEESAREQMRNLFGK